MTVDKNKSGFEYWMDGFTPLKETLKMTDSKSFELERFSELVSEKIVSVTASKDGTFLITTETDIYLTGKTVLDNWILKPLKFTLGE